MVGLENAGVLTVSDDLPVPVSRPVHSGKVRSVYFLQPEDSRRLIEERGYAVAPHSDLALMVISDRLSAFDCLWRSRNLEGVPGKGAALNAIAAHWFRGFESAGIAAHHLLEVPHPLLWIVRQARPVRMEAIARLYLTGSLWRAYEAGARQVGGVNLPEGLAQYDVLPRLLFTPSTKGVMRGIEGVPESDDAPLDPAILRSQPKAFGLRAQSDVDACMAMLEDGFVFIEQALALREQLLVDTKFEFGMAPAIAGGEELIVMDEVGTPDSSRIWFREDWARGQPRERSKEQFRAALLDWAIDRRVLLEPSRMAERLALARDSRLPDEFFLDLAETYRDQARAIVGDIPAPDPLPRDSLCAVLAELGLLARAG
ncbi:MAG: phosphoribosylaminoimidazolesuccinocarboxamide synthase [Pseudomonadota bacterium]